MENCTSGLINHALWHVRFEHGTSPFAHRASVLLSALYSIRDRTSSPRSVPWPKRPGLRVVSSGGFGMATRFAESATAGTIRSTRTETTAATPGYLRIWHSAAPQA